MSAAALVAALRARHLSVATGESLTAGAVSAAIASVPGCSDVFRGGVTAYSADVKASVLGLSPEELAAGIVSETVAGAMARQAARLLGADVGLGTTGAAGPEPHAGTAVGTVCVAVWWEGTAHTWTVHLTGGREAVRRESVELVLVHAVELLT